MQLSHLTVFSAIISLITVGSIIYIAVTQPAYLRKSSEGTPYFTPPVENPDGGEPIHVDELIRHYKGS